LAQKVKLLTPLPRTLVSETTILDWGPF
jgi:hypothetical protein